MSKWRPRPLRSLRHEAISLLEIAAIPAAIAFVFPYEAVGFRADERESGRKPSCAFVTLTDEGRVLKEHAKSIPAQVGSCVRLTPEEAKTLYRLLYKLLDTIE